MNRIWDVRAKPGQGIWGTLRKRVLSFGMVLSIAFLLLVSLVMSAAISAVFSQETLLWVYYSSLVFFLGAEMTEAYAGENRSPIVPDASAERVPRSGDDPKGQRSARARSPHADARRPRVH